MLKAITRQARTVDSKIEALNADPDRLKDALVKASEQQGKPDQSIRRPPGEVTTAWFFDHLAGEEDIAFAVTEDDFAVAKTELVPSVSVEELRHYERVRKTFEGQAKEKEKDRECGPRTQQHANGELKGAGNAARPSLPIPRYSQKAVSRRKRDTAMKSKGKGKAVAHDIDDDADEEVMDGGLGDRESGSDDDFIIRADSDGFAGKGKGKAIARGVGNESFGDATTGDEDLYS